MEVVQGSVARAEFRCRPYADFNVSTRSTHSRWGIHAFGEPGCNGSYRTGSTIRSAQGKGGVLQGAWTI
jgi:hypothetical protein